MIKIIDNIAVLNSETPVITNIRTALDLMATIGYEHNINKLAISKSAISEDFFDLKTGFAGEISQKFVQYGFQIAIFGDFSMYISKPLKDYMYECNQGSHLFFLDL